SRWPVQTGGRRNPTGGYRGDAFAPPQTGRLKDQPREESALMNTLWIELAQLSSSEPQRLLISGIPPGLRCFLGVDAGPPAFASGTPAWSVFTPVPAVPVVP